MSNRHHAPRNNNHDPKLRWGTKFALRMFETLCITAIFAGVIRVLEISLQDIFLGGMLMVLAVEVRNAESSFYENVPCIACAILRAVFMVFITVMVIALLYMEKTNMLTQEGALSVALGALAYQMTLSGLVKDSGAGVMEAARAFCDMPFFPALRQFFIEVWVKLKGRVTS